MFCNLCVCACACVRVCACVCVCARWRKLVRVGAAVHVPDDQLAQADPGGGCVQERRRVMGNASRALGTKVVTRPQLLWHVPKAWSLAEAASVPTAYMTAYYALVMRGRLHKGMRVLIHSAAGAVGLAAVRICLSRGAQVSSWSACSFRAAAVAAGAGSDPKLSACVKFR